MEGNFTDGIPNGLMKQYLKNDDTYIEGNWVNGKREGRFKVTNELKKVSYKNFVNDIEMSN
jgi:antitoxin component YwqK of YwqJK toxin-antitoxin module